MKVFIRIKLLSIFFFFHSSSTFCQCLNSSDLEKVFTILTSKNSFSLKVGNAFRVKFNNCLNDTLKIKLALQLAKVKYSNRDIYGALEESELAESICSKNFNQSKKLYLKTIESLGFYHFQASNYEKSNQYYDKLAKKADNPSVKSYAFHTIATTKYLLGDYEQSILVAKKGLNFSKFDYYQSADLNNIISNSYYDLSNFSLSFYHIKKALDFHERWQKQTKLNDEYANGIFLLNYGNNLVEQGNYKESLIYFKNATILLQKAGMDEKVIYNGLVNQGDVYERLNEMGKAKEIYLKADLMISRLFPSKPNVYFSRVYGNLAKIYCNEKSFELATLTFLKAFKQFPKFNFSSKYNNYIKLRDIGEKSILQDIISDYNNCMIEYYNQSNKTKFLNEGLRASQINDFIVDAMRQEHTGTLSKYFWRNKTRSLYENAIETCFLLKDFEKAYYFMEKSRAVMLNDKLNELGAKQKLNEADQEKEREFQRKIIELNTKIEAETKAAEKEKLNSQLFDLQEQQERFVKSLETKYPAYYQLKYNTQIGTLKQMQAYLKSNFKGQNASMVSYFFGDSASYAMVISPTKAEIKQFKYDEAQNQAFVNLLAGNQGTKTEFAQVLSSGSNIYEKLIKPLNLPKGHLIISQDGVFMPFEALSTSATKAHYLLNDYAISYTYSGQFLLKKQVETKFWPNQTFVGFAPVSFKNQLNSLKNSDISLGNVANNYWFSDTFTGKVATKDKFLQQAKDHKIVQIFTHAFADSVDTEPKIYFADQALKISELNAEDQFNTQLLVLSACKTGVGKLAKGEGILSLARGFSMLGIPATITSLWSVEDKNTYLLTELFYKYLNQGLSKDQALQKAKLEFLKLHPNSGPTDWAGMVLVGESSELASNGAAYLVLGIIFSVAILAGGFYYSRKRRAA